MSVLKVDLKDPLATRKLMKGVDSVVHLANEKRWVEPGLLSCLHTNMQIHMNVFEAAAESGVKKLVFASSVHVFNATFTDGTLLPGYRVPYLPLDGRVPPLAMSPYGMSKQFCETVLGQIHRATGMTTIAIRLPVVPSNDRVEAYASGKVTPYQGAEHAGFSYLSLRDTASLIEAILSSSQTGHSIYFPASAHNLLGRSAGDVISEYYSGVPTKKPLQQIRSLVDVSDITNETGWKPTD